ncbi:glutathione S-transferase, microsomal [Ceratobasidium sp. AG-Ba]|nr:glutathione S-transferase, microsomal [Ceratobasidium sp. AG-Ba]QRW01926.1 glutathione S-transferase, microsomal [Ceratobasidium sp. AG-Ba]
MSVTITLPEHYGYVVLAAVSTGFLTAWQTSYVSSGRKKAGVKYPQMYAEREQMEKDPEAVRYNCAQRAHQNTLEWLPHVLFFLPFLGLRHPIAAASLGAGWNVGRILYTLGYTTGDPAKRNTRGGILASISYAGLLLGSTYAAIELALGRW